MKERIVSYSQVNEDIILYHILKEKANKVFWIDVGANDPFILSVTKLFYDKGSRGINIEPLKKYAEKYEIERPDDINLECGIGKTNGKMSLYGDDTGASFLYEGPEKTKHEVNVYTLESICNKYVEHDQEIHFLKIDVEGFEKDVLEGMDFSKYRPWIIAIEAYENTTNRPVYLEWENLILDAGYSFSFEHEQNRYYIANEKKDIVDTIEDIDQMIKQYEIYNISNMIEENEKYSLIANSKTWRILRKLLNVVDRIMGRK